MTSRWSGEVTVVGPNGKPLVLYKPQPHQLEFHLSDTPNLLALGTRKTGKSVSMRWDILIRCLQFPGFKALVLRRTIPDLRKSHLRYINAEMRALGQGHYRETTSDVKFNNGSFLQFSHCEKLRDVDNYLGGEWDYIGFDELSTFTLEMFLLISAATATTIDKPYKALVRACSNPLGPGAQWMKEWFIDKTVNLADYPDYLPDDFEMQFSTLEQNKYIPKEEYEKRLRNLPEHVRRAWLLGEFVMEGAYFTDFKANKMVEGRAQPWHVVPSLPTWKGDSLLNLPWANVYRSVDWGYHPDPAVCHWHVVLPNKQKITFKERTWRRTLAADVAAQIKRESAGMHVVDTMCDPTMFIKTGNAPYSIAEIFEQNGVPCTPAQNDRELYGYALHEMLNTTVDEQPAWQIVGQACPELVRTLPILQMDPHDARKIANGPDHWAISCAYFAMGGYVPSRDPITPIIPRWMQRKPAPRRAYV